MAREAHSLGQMPLDVFPAANEGEPDVLRELGLGSEDIAATSKPRQNNSIFGDLPPDFTFVIIRMAHFRQRETG